MTSNLKSGEKTLFEFINGPVELNETKYPPNQENCTNKTNTTEINPGPSNITIINVTQPLIIIPGSTPKCNERWDYKLKGRNWECLCAEGTEQSPIDLPPKNQATISPIKPIFEYEVVSSTQDNIETIDRVNEANSEEGTDNSVKLRYHNGAIKIQSVDIGKAVLIDGSYYTAEEIQFHTPSEHTIAGQRFDMEMQVIHYGKSKGDIAKQVVLSFLFKKTAGKYNKFIDSLDFYSLPNPNDNVRELYNDIFVPNVFYSSDEEQVVIMKPFSFYSYEGSLTFPPCTQRTKHFIASEPIELSSTAISLFKEALRKPDSVDEKGNIVSESNPVRENYRETQPLNEREVFIYDHKKYDCPQFTKKPKKAEPYGHYEKRVRDVTQFVYVDGKEPTGIPGAFVVTESEAKSLQEKKQDIIEEIRN